MDRSGWPLGEQRPLPVTCGSALKTGPPSGPGRLCGADDWIKDVSFCCLSSVDYVVLEDNNPLCKALEDKRLPENHFRTLLEDNHGTTANMMRYECT